MSDALTQTARSLADAFEHKTRDNGQAFYCLRDGAPEWMAEAIREAHDGGEMMPNDWSYSFAHSMAEHIAEALEYDASGDLDDIVSEGANSLVPCYTGERLAWLSSHVHRLAYVEEWIEQAGGLPKGGGLYAAITGGISLELKMIGRALVAAIEAESEAQS